VVLLSIRPGYTWALFQILAAFVDFTSFLHPRAGYASEFPLSQAMHVTLSGLQFSSQQKTRRENCEMVNCDFGFSKGGAKSGTFFWHYIAMGLSFLMQTQKENFG
jgi:hypothetical protein